MFGEKLLRRAQRARQLALIGQELRRKSIERGKPLLGGVGDAIPWMEFAGAVMMDAREARVARSLRETRLRAQARSLDMTKDEIRVMFETLGHKPK